MFFLLTLAESSPFWYNRFRKGRLPPLVVAGSRFVMWISYQRCRPKFRW
nr:MAG TPA: hypothetical protein [Caudoviricetes sp.]